MPRIEGDELKPCQELYAIGKDSGYINLMTHFNHSMCYTGCLDGKGDCRDYILARRVTRGIRHIASLVEARPL